MTGFSIMFLLLIIFMFIIILIAALYFLTAIPLYTMGKNSGYKNAWMAYVPIVQLYLMVILSKKKWSLFNGTFHVKKRDNIFWIYIGASYLGSFVISIFSIFPIIGIFSIFLSLLLSVALYIVYWSFVKDLFDTFRPNDDNMAVSIFSIFIPIVFIVMLWIMRNNSPVYGKGNYYNDNYNKSVGFIENKPVSKNEQNPYI